MSTVTFDKNVDYQALINKTTDPTLKAQYEEQRAAKIASSTDSELKTYGVDRAGRNTATAVKNPDTLTKTEMATLMANDCANDITIVHADNSTEKVTGYVMDGHSYTVTSDGGGQVLIDYDTQSLTDGNEQISSSKWTYDDHTANGIKYHGSSTIKLNDAKPYTSPPCYSPPKPAFQTFNEPIPTFSSDLEAITKYSYFYGLDKLTLMHNTINQNCCFVSQSISVGSMTTGEYLQLEADCDIDENSSVEFYIVDGSKEVPILPIKETVISNEKVFFGLRPRFSIDTSAAVQIKKDMQIVDYSLDKAIQSNDALYTVSYTPVNAYNYTPLNSSIKIKVVMRLYNTAADAPSINKIKIRKYGGDTLWKQDISVI